jgi:hypothetical protein
MTTATSLKTTMTASRRRRRDDGGETTMASSLEARPVIVIAVIALDCSSRDGYSRDLRELILVN